MKTLGKFINEKLKISMNKITYETFMEEFQKLNNPDIHFRNHTDHFNGDYPKFQAWYGMNNAYKKCVGKKFKNMYILNTVAGKELHVNFMRQVNSTIGIIIENTDDLYNFLGEEQVLEIYNIIKERID